MFLKIILLKNKKYVIKRAYGIHDIFNSWQVVKHREAKFINKLKEKFKKYKMNKSTL